MAKEIVLGGDELIFAVVGLTHPFRFVAQAMDYD